MSFEDDLKAQLEAERDTVDVPFTLNDNPYLLRFTQLDSWIWAAEADRHPMRPDVTLDRTFGYNMRSLVRAIAPTCGQLFREGEPVELHILRDDKGNVIQDDWDALFRAMSPAAVQNMCTSVFSLHESESINTVVEQAKKLLAPAAKNSKRR